MSQTEKTRKPKIDSVRKARQWLLSLVAVLVFVGLGYLYWTWSDSVRLEETRALDLAESADAFLDADTVAGLSGTSADIGTPAYENIKKSLTAFKNKNDGIHFAYLMTYRDGKVLYLVDSEAPGSAEYSAPGDELPLEDIAPLERLLQGESFVSKPASDRWGTWITALVPVVDPQTGETVAALGVDYAATHFNGAVFTNMLHAIIEVFFIFLLVITLYRILLKNVKLKKVSRELESSRRLFKTIFVQAPVGMAVVRDFRDIVTMNAEFGRILGRSNRELNQLRWSDITHPDDLDTELSLYEKMRRGAINGYSLEKRFIKPDGSSVWVNVVNAAMQTDAEEGSRYIAILRDINEQKLAQDALKESERSKTVFLSNLPGMAYRCAFDKDWTMEFVSDGCQALTGYTPHCLIRNKELSFNDLIAPEYRDVLWLEWERVLSLRMPFQYEYEILCADGRHKWVLEMGQGIFNGGEEPEALEGIILDITEQKAKEELIGFMSSHDTLTGLYNRKHYEEVLEALDAEDKVPLSVIVADINGVRLVNNAFGYSEGDRLIREAGNILSSCCRERDILARVGGDEFRIILPQTDEEDAHRLVHDIYKKLNIYNKKKRENTFDINLSVGYATKTCPSEDIQEVVKVADSFLRNRKLLNHNSSHSDIVTSIMATVFEKSQKTKEHSEHIAVLIEKIGQRLELSPKEIGELELLAVLHDIGKIGIDDSVLNKPGPLTKEEWAIMKKHPEIGYRIAKASSELEHIAEFILYHHERWDGTGYPKGLSGEEIPLLSRILAVADAYDAMTEDRVYRKAMDTVCALKELKNNAGTQFDPQIVEIFVDGLMLEGSLKQGS